jgi:hypothetical protein
MIVSLATTTAGGAIYYTTDGSTPTASSTQYIAPFLMTSSATLNAITVATDYTNSSVSTQSITANVASGALAWSDEFSNATNANAAPNPNIWTYDTGGGGFGNSELENYRAGRRPEHCGAAALGGGLYLSAHEDGGIVQLPVWTD